MASFKLLLSQLHNTFKLYLFTRSRTKQVIFWPKTLHLESSTDDDLRELVNPKWQIKRKTTTNLQQLNERVTTREIVDLQISHLYKNKRKNQKDMKSLTFFNWQLKKHN